MLSNDVIEILKKLVPESLADSWDNSGLQIGSLKREVQKVLVSLDLEKNAIEKAIEENCDMIVTHHPFFFGEVKNIQTDGTRGEIIRDAIKNDIVVYSAHTNLDVAKDGMNKVLGKKLELEGVSPIAVTYSESLYKLAVYVPREDAEVVRDVLGDAGAGSIGNYDHCSFSMEGTGRFRPLDGAHPHIGSTGVREEVAEEKIEVILEKSNLEKAVRDMKAVHPYEEVAYDVYELLQKGERLGYGGIGKLQGDETLKSFALKAKEKLECSEVRVYGDLQKSVERVAFCGGSGASFIKDVAKRADVYVTGDIKYHDAQLAEELGLALVDAGHFGTEKHIVEHIASYLEAEIGEGVEVSTFEYDFSNHVTL